MSERLTSQELTELREWASEIVFPVTRGKVSRLLNEIDLLNGQLDDDPYVSFEEVPAIARRETYVMQYWEESEAGWGVRPDGWSLHATDEDRQTFIKQYWDRMPAATPAEYERPSGSGRVIAGSLLTQAEVEAVYDADVSLGVRYYNSDYPTKRDSK